MGISLRTLEQNVPKPGFRIPRHSLSVGVTGHRLDRLGEKGAGRVQAIAPNILELIEAGSSRLPGGRPADAFRLVTAVADGADTLFGEAALDRGWILDVVLPFGRKDYELDFALGGARETYARLLQASRSVFELGEASGSEAERAVAYERAGRIVLAQVDLLIAVWDTSPVRGRGGAAQIAAEAVLQGIPVIHIDPSGGTPPKLLWDGLQEHDLGQQTIETVPRGDLAALPDLLSALLRPPVPPGDGAPIRWFERGGARRRAPAIAYTLLLAIMGVERPRWRAPPRSREDGLDAIAQLCTHPASGFVTRVGEALSPRFARADRAATHSAQLFRSGYVTNFSLAAAAVLLTLLGLALPVTAKSLLTVLELGAVMAILLVTHAGRRAGWHRRWLDCRQLAERLRCLAVSAQLGELDLRSQPGQNAGWVNWYVRATAREIGLPSAHVDERYLLCCREGLIALVDDQIAYLARDAGRMHRLEHRLHIVGTILFSITGLTCFVVLMFEVAHRFHIGEGIEHWAQPLLTATTIASAALPALGAAIYGIRMQGDFAGSAERSEALRHHLASLRLVMEEDALDFDTLRRRALRATDLLTSGLNSWLQTYEARPLSLPG